MTSKRLIGSLAVMCTALLAGCQSASAPSSPTAPVAGVGEHCGGNMANAATCAAGYHCGPTAGSTLPFGDVGGTCVAD
jgi:hypothetical protein